MSKQYACNFGVSRVGAFFNSYERRYDDTIFTREKRDIIDVSELGRELTVPAVGARLLGCLKRHAYRLTLLAAPRLPRAIYPIQVPPQRR